MSNVIQLKDIDFSKFKPGKKIMHNETDFSICMSYNDAPFIVETSPLVMVLGILKFANPHYPNVNNFSMSIAIPEEKDEKGDYINEFTDFLYAFETAVMEFQPEGIDLEIIKDRVYDSPIRKKNKPEQDNHLRVKIYANNEDELKFDNYADKSDKITSTLMTYKEAKKTFVHGTKARYHLELRKIWYSVVKKTGVKKFGYSWGLHGMQIQKVGFTSTNENTKI